MRRKVIFLAVLLIVILGVIYNTTMDEEILDITVGNTKIEYEILENDYSLSRDLFKYAFEVEKLDDIKYVDIGEKVHIDFGNNPPDKFVIKDHLLNNEGMLMYSSKEILDIPVSGDNHKDYFVVNKHFASALSSYYEKNKKDYRGIAIIATKGETEIVYKFVIKTDAF